MPSNWGREAAAELRRQLSAPLGRIDVFGVIRELGIELYLRSMPDDPLDGAHQLVGDAAFIFINSAHAITRQRFTAAHELGHHRHGIGEGPAVFENDVARLREPTEVGVNQFAAYFLIDPEGAHLVADELDDPRERVVAVASRFAVSPESSAIHLSELRLISRAFKDELCGKLRTKEVRPGELFRAFDYPPTTTPDAAPFSIDPAHVERAVRAYDVGLMTLVGLADALGTSTEEAAEILRRSDVEVVEEVEAEARASAH